MKDIRLGITSPIARAIISLSLLASLPVKAEVTVADLKNLPVRRRVTCLG
jgi:hypothetical protein